jgi:hypothetical protein
MTTDVGPSSGAPDDLRERLDVASRGADAAALGFHGRDAADLADAVRRVREQPRALDVVARLADRLRGGIGDFTADGEGRRWSVQPDDAGAARASEEGALGPGVLPMLALLVTAAEVAAWHTARGVPSAISVETLADLGQQVRVHRRAYGVFGLHSQDWLSLAWSGSLYRLGRLQHNLQRPDPALGGDPDRWVLGVHIPATGRLDADEVDASFTAATRFFAEHFPDRPVADVVCRSWLLDPALAEVLPDSNLAAFCRRWSPYGDPQPGDDDVQFFVFSRRGPVDRAALPADTTLRRAVLARWAAGGSWSLVSGRLAR